MSGKLFKTTGNILVKILIVLIVASFALWGVGDVFRGRTTNTVAKVGDEEIGLGTLQTEMRMQLKRLEQVFGGPVPTDVAKSMNIQRGVLQQLVNEKLVKQEAHALGLRVSEEQVLDEVRANDAFKNPDGTFSGDRFQAYLSQIGETEETFVKKIQEAVLVRSLMEAVAAEIPVTEMQSKMLVDYLGESRKLEYFTIPTDYKVTVPDPSETELVQFFEQNKVLFSAPEYRDVSYVAIDEKAIKNDLEVTEAQIKEVYESRADEFSVPEQRSLQHMLFETQEKADEAAKALVEGKAFKEVAKELAGQDASATDFGKATRNELLEGMADAVFTTEKGSYTPPLASPLGFHIFKVVDVTAAKPLPFKQVKDAIKRAIVEEKMMEYRYTLVNQLQDALASGSSLEDVAEAFNLSLKKATTIDNNGLNADGNAAKLPKEPIFLATVFSLDEGAEPELVTNKEGTASYIIRVDGAQQARLRALDEVRGKVVAAWKKEESGQQRKTLAQKAVKALKEDSTLSKEASRFGASVQTVSIARADNKKSELPAILVEEAFTIEKGKTTGAYANPEGDLVIARVAAVVPASEHLSEETREQILRAHKEGYVEDMFRQYTIYLQRQYPVEVFIDMNETAN